jgi:type IV secretion system protein VirB10
MSDVIDDELVADTPAPPKVDPESLVLRAKPARAIRFKRGVVVAIAAMASVSVVATAWVALRPSAFHIIGRNDDRGDSGKVESDTLSGLPSSYGDAPKLGPPLPGDLGRAILEQRQGSAPGPGLATPISPPADQAATSEREAQLAQLKAARQSGLMIKAAEPERGGAGASMPGPDSPPVLAKPALDPERDPNAQGRKLDFVGSNDANGPSDPHSLTTAASPYMLSAGSIIAASLITGLRSDLPGLVTAQVTERVYDSATGKILLIPQGARLIGSYDSVVAFGQRRALVVWQRIILPNGSSLGLDNVPATDPSGYAGLTDKVDFHTWSLLKGVVISTLLGAGSSLTFSGETDLVQALRESTQQSASRAGDQLTSRNLQVQPTITIRPGSPLRLVVHRDLILAPWPK